MKSFELSLFADYFQFYIQDEAVTGDLSKAWNEETTSRLLAMAPGTIGIGTDVPVTVEILTTNLGVIFQSGITLLKPVWRRRLGELW